MVQWRNTSQSFGWIHIVLHWLMAVVVVGLFALGLYMVDLDYFDPWYHRAPAVHKSIAILLALVFIGRVIWRQYNPTPNNLARFPWQRRAASSVHFLLYCLLLLTFCSGYFMSTAANQSVSVFGWFSIPALGVTIPNQADIAGKFHYYTAWTLITLATGHGLLALKHHFLDRDNTLKRMLKPLFLTQ